MSRQCERGRRGVLGALCALVLAVSAGLASVAAAEAPLRFFRIGTASTAGTYFPIGGIIANAISHPPGSRKCEQGGSCGVPGLIAVVQSTQGSVDNATQIARHALDSGFVQADVAYWAYHGAGLFADRGPADNLRAIANLYPEAIHLLVRQDAGIREMADLAGKRISLDVEGSGTRVDALLILEAYGLSPADFEAVSLPAGQAADMMRAGELDGFFFVAGTPAKAVETLAQDVAVDLVPIDGAPAKTLRERYPFFAPHSISAGTYRNVAQTDTVSVGAQWLVDAKIDPDTVYAITKALWHTSTRRLLDSGHPKGELIRLSTALDGLGVPLHAGARRYYVEAGVLQPDERVVSPRDDPAAPGD